MRASVLFAAFLVAAGCGGQPRPASAVLGAASRGSYVPETWRNARPQTRAERSEFRETSTYADVVGFIDSLKTLGAQIEIGSIGKTGEGRDIPYVIASRPLVRTPAEARRLNRPIVYVQANIHGGEVEGKEAVQSLLRDLTMQRRQNLLDSVVLIAVPIYNADGNERFGPQERNRGSQNGPEQVGQRPNAASLDLNRDYIKADAPETRASLAMFDAWDPDVFMDLHTTNGSLHGYALTYSPSLNQAAITTEPISRTLVQAVRRRMIEERGFHVFDYGNFSRPGAEMEIVDPARRDTISWVTYDSRPRYGTNYYGLRGRIAVLSEAYSHDPLQRRIAATYDFVREVMTFVAENHEDVLEATRGSDRRVTGWGSQPATSPQVGVQARPMSSPPVQPVRVEVVESVPDSVRTEPGLRRGTRRTGAVRMVPMRIVDRFEGIAKRQLPYAYVIPAELRDSVVPRLRMHGVVVEQLAAPAQVTAQSFTIDSLSRAARPFQGHQEVVARGRWGEPGASSLAAGTFIVRAGQPRGLLAFYLLEPDSDDGLVTWNMLDPFIAVGRSHPITRVTVPIRLELREVRD